MKTQIERINARLDNIESHLKDIVDFQPAPFAEACGSAFGWTEISARKPAPQDLPVLLWNAAVPKMKYSATTDSLRSQMGLTCFTHWMRAPSSPSTLLKEHLAPAQPAPPAEKSQSDGAAYDQSFKVREIQQRYADSAKHMVNWWDADIKVLLLEIQRLSATPKPADTLAPTGSHASAGAEKGDGARLDWLLKHTWITYHTPGVYSVEAIIKNRHDIDVHADHLKLISTTPAPASPAVAAVPIPTCIDWAEPRVAEFMRSSPHVAFDGMWVEFANQLARELSANQPAVAEPATEVAGRQSPAWEDTNAAFAEWFKRLPGHASVHFHAKDDCRIAFYAGAQWADQQSTAREASLRDEISALKEENASWEKSWTAKDNHQREALEQVGQLTAKLKEAEAKLADANNKITQLKFTVGRVEEQAVARERGNLKEVVANKAYELSRFYNEKAKEADDEFEHHCGGFGGSCKRGVSDDRFEKLVSFLHAHLNQDQRLTQPANRSAEAEQGLSAGEMIGGES